MDLIQFSTETNVDLIEFTSPKLHKNKPLTTTRTDVVKEHLFNNSSSCAYSTMSTISSENSQLIDFSDNNPSLIGDSMLYETNSSITNFTNDITMWSPNPGDKTSNANVTIMNSNNNNNNNNNTNEEDSWLCDPKHQLKNQQKNLQNKLAQNQMQQQTIMNDMRLLNNQRVNTSIIVGRRPEEEHLLIDISDKKVENEFRIVTDDDDDDSSQKMNLKKPNAANPYKWLQQDFQDKNLDKVKRTLLVALDDLSKGTYRRSRSHNSASRLSLTTTTTTTTTTNDTNLSSNNINNETTNMHPPPQPTASPKPTSSSQ
jgi:hypothetical protein